MKRPLCYLCLAYVVSVLIYLMFFHSSFEIPSKEGEWGNFYGMVYNKEVTSERTVLYLKHVQNLQAANSKEEKYHIICYCDAKQKIPEIGRYITVTGSVKYFKEARNPGEFDQKNYYEVQKVAFSLEKTTILQYGRSYNHYREYLFLWKQKLERKFDFLLPQSDASVMNAILLGDKKNLDQDRKMLFQKSGISHILAISGLHISILGMGLYRLLKKCRMPLEGAIGISILFMLIYGDLVGSTSSCARAILMFVMQLGAVKLKRTYDSKTAIAFSAASILLEQPASLFEAGFLLSFGAVIGIVCFMPLFRTENTKQKIYTNLSILLVQLPIILFFFYEFSLYTVVINLLLLPLVSVLLILGIGILIFDWLPAAGIIPQKVAAAVCHFLLTLFEKVCAWSVELPGAQCILGRPPLWKIVIYYLILFGFAVLHGKKKKRFSRQYQLALMLICIHFLISSPSDGLQIAFLDVGQGDCIWIKNDNGHHYLIDCGSTSKSKVGKYTLIPFLKYKGVSQIDMLFVTHLDTDHISGVMELLENQEGIKIKQLYLSGQIPEDEKKENFIQKCNEQQIPVSFLKAGDICQDGQVKFEILYPARTDVITEANASSLIMKMEYYDFHALFTGDAQEEGERKAAQQLENWKCHVFKVTHHGSGYSNTEQLLDTVRPEIAVISCGENNSYGHPHKETLDRLEKVNSRIFMTKGCGEIEIKVKKSAITVKTYLP